MVASTFVAAFVAASDTAETLAFGVDDETASVQLIRPAARSTVAPLTRAKTLVLVVQRSPFAGELGAVPCGTRRVAPPDAEALSSALPPVIATFDGA